MNWFLIITLLVVIPAELWLFRAVYELTDMVSRIMSKCYTIETTVNLISNVLDGLDLWISTDDARPIYGRLVLVCTKDGTLEIAMRIRDNAWLSNAHQIPDGNVIAWMELPESYKKDAEE